MVQAAFNGHMRCEGAELEQTYAVIRADPVVICAVGKRQCQQTLFLQIGLVDTRETAGNDSHSAQESRTQRCMFPAASLAVVGITNDDPGHLPGSIRASGRSD